jgi:hypothetical protein
MSLDSVGVFRERRVCVRDVIKRLLNSDVHVCIEELVLQTDMHHIAISEDRMANVFDDRPPVTVAGPIDIRKLISFLLMIPLDALVHELVLIPKNGTHKLVVKSEGLEAVLVKEAGI